MSAPLFCVVDKDKEALLCAVCRDPIPSASVQLPCPGRHCFCAACIMLDPFTGPAACPCCRGEISDPHNIPKAPQEVIDAAQQLVVECGSCKEQMKASMRSQHKCSGVGEPPLTSGAALSPAPPMPQPVEAMASSCSATATAAGGGRVASMEAEQLQQQTNTEAVEVLPSPSSMITPPPAVAVMSVAQAAEKEQQESEQEELAAMGGGRGGGAPAPGNNAFSAPLNGSSNNNNFSSSSGSVVPPLPGMAPFLASHCRSGAELPPGVAFSTVGGQGAAEEQVLGYYSHSDAGGAGAAGGAGPHQSQFNVISTPLPPPPQQQQEEMPGVWTEFGFTQKLYDHFLALFFTFDADGNGSLDQGEVTRLAKHLNYVTNDQDAARMFHEMDGYRKGRISQNDFFSWLAQHRPDPTALYGLSIEQYHTILFAFHELDNGARGTLDRDRWRRLAMRFNFARTFQECDQLFNMIDQNHDRCVSLHELLVFMNTRGRGGGRQQYQQPPPQMQHLPPPYQQPPQQYQQPPAQMQQHQYQHQHHQFQQPPQFRVIPGQQQHGAPGQQQQKPQKKKDDCCIQ